MSAPNYARCIAFTLQYEGGFVDNPHDPGGPTCEGITQVTLSHELGRKATVTEVRALRPNLPIVQSIYRKKYWNLIEGDELPFGVDLMAFDIAVNMGPRRAMEWLDETKTLLPLARIHKLHDLRMGFWKHLAIWSHFGKGWTRREVACFAFACNMALKPMPVANAVAAHS